MEGSDRMLYQAFTADKYQCLIAAHPRACSARENKAVKFACLQHRFHC
jgi:hypothetical protein